VPLPQLLAPPGLPMMTWPVRCQGQVTYCGINADGAAIARPGSKRHAEGMNWACTDQLSNLDPTYIAPNCHGEDLSPCRRSCCPAIPRALATRAQTGPMNQTCAPYQAVRLALNRATTVAFV